MIRSLRDEALQLLNGGGAILDVAREVSRIAYEADLPVAIVGGVAVVLHGYTRTTSDVDVYTGDVAQALAAALRAAGYTFHRTKREFRRKGVPVHFVTDNEARTPPTGRAVEIDDIRTVSLPDLINMKLASGLRDPLRAIDIADVIGLIRARRLTPAFAARLGKTVRTEFRKLARAIAKRG